MFEFSVEFLLYYSKVFFAFDISTKDDCFPL